jgi:hypothetical protein
MSIFGRKVVLVSVLALAAAGWFWRQQQAAARTRVELASARTELARLDATRKLARDEWSSLERELGKARSERDALLGTVAEQNRQDKARATESRWGVPPEHWPEWNEASPYVWLSKGTFKRMQAPVWDQTDGLRDEIVALLAIQPEAREAIDATVRRLMAEWRSAETAAATLSPDHLSNLGGEGEAVTVRVQSQPELVYRMRNELHALLEQKLGEQRAGLFEHFAEWRLDAEFGLEKIYSVRREGKAYRIATQGWSGSMGTMGNWRDNIPAHLHPIFAEALKQR